VGAPYKNVLPEWREDVRQLVGHLNRIHPTKLEIVEYVPGRHGLPWAETVSIWIGTNLASSVAGAVMSDVYEVANVGRAIDSVGNKRKRPVYGCVPIVLSFMAKAVRNFVNGSLTRRENASNDHIFIVKMQVGFKLGILNERAMGICVVHSPV